MRIADSQATRIYLRLLGFVRPYARVFALSVVAMLALAGTEWMLPALLKPLIDVDFEAAAEGGGYLTPMLLVALFLLRGGLSYVATVSLHWVAHRTIADLRNRMFDTLLRLPAAYFDHNGGGELTAKFTFDVTQVAQATTRVVTVMIKDSAVVVVLLSYLLWLNWQLAAFLLLFAPPVAWLVRRVSRRMRDMSRRLQHAVGDINQVAGEAVRGQREIKVFDGYDYEAARFAQAVDGARKFQMKVIRTGAMLVPVIQLMVACGIALMIVFALREAGSGGMTRGDFIAFVTATALLLPPIKRLAGANEFLQRGIAAAESVFALCDTPVETADQARASRLEGRVSFHEVSLHYGDTVALEGISLEVSPGESIALVGRSGGGKTSLVSLLPRFYEPSSGVVSFDDEPATGIALPDLRANIAFVGQQVVLFDDTIYNNIAYGALRDAPRAAVEAAAQQAQVSAFAEQMTDGLDTVVGENGVRLSGGQRQRVAIARALLKDAPLLILDEATAALDNEAERLVQEALKTLQRGRTAFIVAHRLSTVVNADRIVVLEGGRIVEQGRHDELLAAGGAYARLHAAGFDDSA